MKTINLLFAVHNHQPVGNFAYVFEEGWKNCYEPFLHILEQFPEFRLTLHYSGSLLEWLEENRPDFLGRLGALVARGQVELLSGGFYEPLLPFIPQADAVGQITLCNRYLQEKLGTQPQGFWLSERVWNPFLPQRVAPTGLQYTILDDSHFRYSGLTDEDMFGHYVTEHEGFSLSIFPIHKRLRYAIPFRPPEETIDALRFWATDSGNLAVTYADDGEKFGLWPGTYHWVFEEKWLEKFLIALKENRDWIHPLTFSEYMQKFPSQGRIYLPQASYDEMMEWALPPFAAIHYADMVSELKQESHYDKYKPFLRGGCWENFLVKYSESNQMHKKMIYVSEKIHRIAKGQPPPEKAPEPFPAPVLRHLWRGQSHSAYWHGLFGGIYSNHLRHAVYQNLIAAETLAAAMEHGDRKYLVHEILDLDRDLWPEISITNEEMGALLKPDYGGSLIELDYRPRRFNLTNVLSRRPEAYHRKLKQSSAQTLAAGKKEELEKALVYDWYNRYSFLDHFLGAETTFDQFRRCQYPEWGDFINQPYELIQVKNRKGEGTLEVYLQRNGGLWKPEGKIPLHLAKCFCFHRDGAELEVDYEIANRSPVETKIWFGVELNLTLIAGHDPKHYVRIPNLPVGDEPMDSCGTVAKVEKVQLRDDAQKFEVTLEAHPASDFWRFPIETISQSERGFEKTYQGTAFLFHWPFVLRPNGKKYINMIFSCKGIST